MGERASELDYGADPVLDPQGNMADMPDDADLAAKVNPPQSYSAGRNAGREAYSRAQAPRSDLPSSARSANSSAHTTSTDANDENADPSQIRDNIEQTRQQMGHTIDAIQEKLSPSHLMHEAEHAVRDATIGRAEEVINDVTDTVQGAGSSILDTIRENPIPSALAAVGLGWLIYKAINNSQANNDNYYGNRPYARGYYGPDYQDRYGQTGYGNYNANYNGGAQSRLSQATNAVQDAAGNATDKVQDVAGNVANTVQDTAGNVADTAQQLASQAQDQVQQIGYEAQYGLARARNWLEQTWESNPLALGAAALAAGAIIGGLIPETSMEDRLMGDQRDALLQKAEGVAQDTVQKVEGAAQNALGTVQQNVAQSQQSTQAKSPTAKGSTTGSTTGSTSAGAQSKGTSSTAPSTSSSTKSGASSTTGSTTGSTTENATSGFTNSQTPPPPSSGTSTQAQPSAH